MEGVDPSGVYVAEYMEADESSFEDNQRQHEPVAPQPQRGSPQARPQQNLLRAAHRVLGEVQGGRLVPGVIPQQQDVAAAVAESQQADEPAPTITVNHVYNIHYQSDRPSPEIIRDVEAYGIQLSQLINNHSTEVSNVDTTVPTDTLMIPTIKIEPELRTVGFFSGKTGINREAEYIPDPKYRKHNIRDVQGEVIELRHLHSDIRRRNPEPCHHVAVIGNPGCGKTVLLKRYAQMVLNHTVRDLDDIEIVHFVNLHNICNESERLTTCELLVDRLIHTPHDNVSKHGFQWIQQNPRKVLFIFDQADQVVANFQSPMERISYSSSSRVHVVLQNIIVGHLFNGCRTLIAARDNAWMEVKGDCRPQKFVSVGSLSDEQKMALTRAVCPGTRGENFCTFLQNRFPAALSLSNDTMNLYFTLASLLWAESMGTSFGSDSMVIVAILENLLRSDNASRNLVHKIPKMKKIAFNLIDKGKLRFGRNEIARQTDVTTEDMEDLVVIAPQHDNVVCFRLLDSDFSYFFTHQIIQEVLAACCVGEMSLEDFKKFLSEKIHSPRWSVVRRILCSMMLNERTNEFMSNYLKRPSHNMDMRSELKDSLQSALREEERLSDNDRFELLASLCEAGEGARNITRNVKKMVFPSVVMTTADLFLLSELVKYVTMLDEVNICLDKSIDLFDFEATFKTLLSYSRNVRIDVARIYFTDRHADAVTKAVRGSRRSYEKIELVINANTSEAVKATLKGVRSFKVTYTDAVPVEEIGQRCEQNLARKEFNCCVM